MQDNKTRGLQLMASGIFTIIVLIGINYLVNPSSCSVVTQPYTIFLAAMIIAGVLVLAYGFYLYLGDFLKARTKPTKRKRKSKKR